MTRLRRQTITLDVTTRGDDPPWAVLDRHLRDRDDVADYKSVKVSDPQDAGPNRERLIDLAVWAAGEDAKRRAGLHSQWEQLDWLRRTPEAAGTACGTACCIAGKVALDDGAEPVFTRYDNATDKVVIVPWTEARVGTTASSVKLPDSDKVMEVREYARSVLGLTDEQGYRLFRGSNTLNDILIVIGDLLRDDDEDDEDEDAESAPGTYRRRTSFYTPSCRLGESCTYCYEDAEAPF